MTSQKNVKSHAEDFIEFVHFAMICISCCVLNKGNDANGETVNVSVFLGTNFNHSS